MQVGTIGYNTNSGLGHLVKAFYDHGVVQRVMTIPHPRYAHHPEWYPPEVTYNRSDVDRFLDGLDSLVIFENAFNHWGIVKRAKAVGVRFLLVPMYEWTPYPIPVIPDLVACPSDLDVDVYHQDYKTARLNIPVEVPWKLRERAVNFVHNAGHGQVGFAKGTPEVLEAMQHVTSPVRLLVRGQPGEPRIREIFEKYKDHPKIELRYGDLPYETLFAEGDVYINAERYNGLSLPLQEAYAGGMLVMTTNRYPANTWLPSPPLIQPAEFHKYRVNQTTFDRATIEPSVIAKTIDDWYGRDISEYSKAGKRWAEANSWEVLKPKWLDLLRD